VSKPPKQAAAAVRAALPCHLPLAVRSCLRAVPSELAGQECASTVVAGLASARLLLDVKSF
jgi:hypothetical protein